MAYKVKDTKKEEIANAKATIQTYAQLEDKAQEEYGTSFKDLSAKEQLEIARKVEKDIRKRIERMY